MLAPLVGIFNVVCKVLYYPACVCGANWTTSHAYGIGVQCIKKIFWFY